MQLMGQDAEGAVLWISMRGAASSGSLIGVREGGRLGSIQFAFVVE